MLVVSDTSPLTALLQIQRGDLLPLLFDRILIPPAVRAELVREHPVLPAWLETQAPNSIPAAIADADLDAGETQALALALEVHADAVLIDERLGRRVAAVLGLHPTGVLGCLILAKRNGHLPAVAPVVSELQSRAGCCFDEALIDAVLRAAGEK